MVNVRKSIYNRMRQIAMTQLFVDGSAVKESK